MGYVGIEWVADTQDDDVAAWRRHGEREIPASANNGKSNGQGNLRDPGARVKKVRKGHGRSK